MLSETDRDSLSDILFNIDLANSFAHGFDYPRFLADMRTFYAVTRCLEIISEASRLLLEGVRGGNARLAGAATEINGNGAIGTLDMIFGLAVLA